MSGNHIQPVHPQDAAVDAPYDGAAAPYGGAPEAPPPANGLKLGRYIAALNRFKWLVMAMVVLGAIGGYAATKFIDPEYEVQTTILLQTGTGSGAQNGGPIQAEELLQQSGWRDLMYSYMIAEPVVSNLSLFVAPDAERDSVLFQSFRANPAGIRGGEYALRVDGNRYVLSIKGGIEIERGALGDSIGADLGFMWQPSPQQLVGQKELTFRVQTPREAARELIGRLRMDLRDRSPFMFVRLTGTNSQRTAATLNEWTQQFVAVATQLKKQKVMQYASILEGQRDYAAANLDAAERALQQFRVRTVTQPSDRPIITPGLEMTNNPVFGRYFDDKVVAEQLQSSRKTLESIAAEGRQSGNISREAVLSVPLVNSDPAASDLVAALKEQSDRETELRTLRERYTDEYPRVQEAIAALTTVRSITVPNSLNAYLEQLSIRERQLLERIDIQGRELQGIPVRTIQEQQLQRQVEVADAMYRNLDLSAAQAKLAEAATIPDVEIVDVAVPPIKPTRNTAPVIILAAIAAALGIGVLLAILLDQVDKRFRYPEQATEDLRLFILGVVPVIAKGKRKRAVDQAAQVVEAFRTIRMNVRYAADPARPLTMTITSPGPNDGKSLIASNLALSFAEAGSRTLIIDGDIRRGELAKSFGVQSKPGLVEYLDGTALIAEVLHPSSTHQNLTVMPAGARRRRAPELLATPRLSQLISQMSAEYDVVIVDSPPLGAGFDAYALATATGNMALVLRAGLTDRKMAEAKLEIVDTLPVRVMGAILNGIKLTGVYQYYSYYQEYAAHDEASAPAPRLKSGDKTEVTVKTQ